MQMTELTVLAVLKCCIYCFSWHGYVKGLLWRILHLISLEWDYSQIL